MYAILRDQRGLGPHYLSDRPITAISSAIFSR